MVLKVLRLADSAVKLDYNSIFEYLTVPPLPDLIYINGDGWNSSKLGLGSF